MKCVIVLGMHRCGTSMVAGVCSRLGVDMGEKPLAKSDFNPKGYYEDRDFQNLNRNILKKSGGSWHNYPPRENILKTENYFKKDLESLITKKSNSLMWGWKDPRTCLTLPLYKPYLSSPKYIICKRDVGKVIDSLKRRNDFDPNKTESIYNHYNSEVEYFTKNENKIYINYEHSLKNKSELVNNLIEFLDIDKTDSLIKKAVNFIGF